jgi:uncharacterized protein (DUF2147 family)
MTKTIITLLSAIILLVAASASWGGSDDILGTWSNDDGKAKIEIFPCAGHYCGKISWLKRPVYTPEDQDAVVGTPREDHKNPDPALRNRPLLGLQIMSGFRYSGDNLWDKGRIYDPESGKTYQSKITLVSPQRLEIRGYVGIPLFGRTTAWTR